MNKIIFLIFLISLYLFAVSGCEKSIQVSANDNRLLNRNTTFESCKDVVLVGAHRGYSQVYPENTLLAYQKAVEIGADVLEIDVRLTSDGIPVLIHDEEVSTTTDGYGLVYDMTLKELKKLDAGSWKDETFKGERIPTLEELLSAMKKYPGLLYNVDIKGLTRETIDAVVTLFEQFELQGKYIINSYDADILRYAYNTYGALCQCYIEDEMTGFDDNPETGTNTYVHAVMLGLKNLMPENIKRYHDLGVEVWSCTPNTEEKIKAHFEAGSKLVLTNDPENALKVRKILNSDN